MIAALLLAATTLFAPAIGVDTPGWAVSAVDAEAAQAAPVIAGTDVAPGSSVTFGLGLAGTRVVVTAPAAATAAAPAAADAPATAAATGVCGVDVWDWTCPGFAGDAPPAAAPGDPAGPATPTCSPVAPVAPLPDVAAMPAAQGTITHEAGAGQVITGMATEFTWNGPEQVSWTQTGQPGLAADCATVPAPTVEFTAVLRRLIFDFDGARTATSTGVVTHRYEQDGSHAVGVTAEWAVPGAGFVAQLPAGSLEHTVAEIRSTLVE